MAHCSSALRTVVVTVSSVRIQAFRFCEAFRRSEEREEAEPHRHRSEDHEGMTPPPSQAGVVGQRADQRIEGMRHTAASDIGDADLGVIAR